VGYSLKSSIQNEIAGEIGELMIGMAIGLLEEFGGLIGGESAPQPVQAPSPVQYPIPVHAVPAVMPYSVPLQPIPPASSTVPPQILPNPITPQVVPNGGTQPMLKFEYLPPSSSRR
jgi:hypothetical protein